MANNKSKNTETEKNYSIQNFINGIRQPGGKKEEKYTPSDVIIGLCGAAMFAKPNQTNQSKLGTLINNPQKSIFFQTKEILEQAVKSSDNKTAIGVKIINVKDDILKILKTKSSDENTPSTSIEIMFKNIKNIDDLVNNLKNINEFNSADVEKLNDKKIAILPAIGNINEIINEFNKIENIDKTKIRLLKNNITDIINLINEIANIELSTIDKSFTDSFENLTKGLRSLESINVENLEKINLSKDAIKDVIINIKSISEGLKEFENLNLSDDIGNKLNSISTAVKSFIDSLNSIDLSKIKGIQDFINDFKKLVISICFTLVLCTLSMKLVNIEDILKFTGTLTLFIGIIVGALWLLRNAKLDSNLKYVAEFGKLVMLLGATLVFGALIFKYVEADDVLGFGLLLSLFMTALTGPFFLWRTIGKVIKLELASFNSLIFACAATLLLGSAIYHFIPIQDIIGFGLLLSTFVFGIISIAINARTFIGKDNKSITVFKDLSQLVFMATISMLIGALFLYIPGIVPNIFKFLKILTLFIVGIGLGLALAARISGGKQLDVFKNLSRVILMATISMIIGAAVMYIPGMKEKIITFSIILLVFISLVSLSIGWASKFITKHTIKTMYALSLVIGIAATALILGPILLKDIDIGQVALFAAVLTGFILAMSGVIYLAGQINKKTLANGLLTIAGIAVIITGLAYVFSLVDELTKEIDLEHLILSIGSIILCVAITGLLVWGVGFIAEKFWKYLLIGTGVVAGIGLVILGLSYVFNLVYGFVKDIDFDILWAKLGGMALVLGAVMAVFTAVGAIFMIPIVGQIFLGALAAGTGAIIGICTTILYLADAFYKIDQSTKNTDYNNIKKVIDIWKNLVDNNISDLLVEFAKIDIDDIDYAIKIAELTHNIGIAISNIAAGIQEYSKLTIPIYDNSGKVTGYRALTTTDFENAAKNISLIITTIGGTLIRLYNGNLDGLKLPDGVKPADIQQLFEYDLFGRTKFGQIVKSTSLIGDMIYKIALGIKNYSELRVPEYDSNGNITGYRGMIEDDFINAANNIKTIIVTIGGALISLANGYVETKSGTMQKIAPGVSSEDIRSMFDANWFGLGNSPFSRIVKNVSKLGDLIYKIAQGIKSYAELQIPATDGNGNIIQGKFKPLHKEDFTTAANNIKTIIGTIGGALISLYYGEIDGLELPKGVNPGDVKDMFKPAWYSFSSDSSPFARVIKQVSKLGTLIHDIAEGIKFYATMQVPETFDENGQPKTWKVLTDEEKNKAAETIKSIIITLGSAIIELTKDSEFIKINDVLKNQIIVDQISQISNVLKPIAEAIGYYATGQFPIMGKDKDGNPIITGVFDINTFVRKKLINNKIITSKGITGVKFAIKENLSTILKSIGEAILEVAKDEEIKDLLTDNDDVTEMMNSISTISQNLTGIFGNITEMLNNKLLWSTITVFVKKPLMAFRNSIDEIYKIFVDEKTGKDIDVDDLEEYVEGLDSITGSLKDVFDNLATILNLEVTDEKVKTLFGVLSTYKTEIFKWNLLGIKLSSFIGIDKLNEFNEFISNIIETINNISNDLKEKSNLFKDSVSIIHSSLETLTNDEFVNKFAQHEKDLENYVKTLNSIDVSKVNSLANLTDSISNLSQQMGKMDKFVDALANKLSVNINYLGKQLEWTYKAIKSSEALHNRREKLIKKSVSDINTLMQKEVLVKVEPVQQNEFGANGEEGGQTPGANTLSATDTSQTGPATSKPAATDTTTSGKKVKKQQKKSNNTTAFRNMAGQVVNENKSFSVWNSNGPSTAPRYTGLPGFPQLP